jgi:hypothetical protein
MSPPVAEAMHCLQASARSTPVRKARSLEFFWVRARNGASHSPGNASVGEAQLGEGSLDLYMCGGNGRAIYWVWGKLASRDIRVTSAVLLIVCFRSARTVRRFSGDGSYLILSLISN